VRQQAVWAAVTVGVEVFGRASTRPVVLQDTNNVVVHLAPGPVVAKVGRWPHSAEVLEREVRVARHLASVGAPVAAPLADLVVDPGTQLPVSFWELLVAVDEPPAPADVAKALAAVHDGLATFPDPLPSWFVGLERAAAALADDATMGALPAADLALLRGAMAAWIAEARALDPATFRPLHGEPHAANVVTTADGPRFIDFEAAGVGPVESDLACLEPAILAAGEFDADPAVLDVMRRLRSAFVATWCWASPHPDMRPHGEHHLEVVRRSY
jgi:Ser/Thr protein kinase RdoA (MazF antagonist)